MSTRALAHTQFQSDGEGADFWDDRYRGCRTKIEPDCQYLREIRRVCSTGGEESLHMLSDQRSFATMLLHETAHAVYVATNGEWQRMLRNALADMRPYYPEYHLELFFPEKNGC